MHVYYVYSCILVRVIILATNTKVIIGLFGRLSVCTCAHTTLYEPYNIYSLPRHASVHRNARVAAPGLISAPFRPRSPTPAGRPLRRRLWCTGHLGRHRCVQGTETLSVVPGKPADHLVAFEEATWASLALFCRHARSNEGLRPRKNVHLALPLKILVGRWAPPPGSSDGCPGHPSDGPGPRGQVATIIFNGIAKCTSAAILGPRGGVYWCF